MQPCPLGVGDVADTYAIRAAAKNLFATGNFDDISIGRDGSVLVVTVAERPSISEITIDGNKAIETEALLDGLKGAGLSVGNVFQRSTLEGMQLELQRQYVLQGRYDARIEAEVIPEPRNRVSIAIDVNEGTVASIKHINVVLITYLSDESVHPYLLHICQMNLYIQSLHHICQINLAAKCQITYHTYTLREKLLGGRAMRAASPTGPNIKATQLPT